MIFVTVFGTTFTVNIHPTWVFYLVLKLTRRYGANLDTRGPMWARFKVFKTCRKFGTANTPI